MVGLGISFKISYMWRSLFSVWVYAKFTLVASLRYSRFVIRCFILSARDLNSAEPLIDLIISTNVALIVYLNRIKKFIAQHINWVPVLVTIVVFGILWPTGLSWQSCNGNALFSSIKSFFRNWIIIQCCCNSNIKWTTFHFFLFAPKTCLLH